MKKIFISTIIIFFILSEMAQAQPRRYVARTFYLDLITYQHALGVGIMGNKEAGNWTAIYSPRANLIMIGNNSFSVGTHLALGLSGKGTNRLRMTYDIPFTFDFNIGHKALQDNTTGFGGFVGLGYGFNQIQAEVGTIKSQGLLLNGGARFLIAERSFMLRGGYLFPLKKERSSVYTVGLLHNF